MGPLNLTPEFKAYLETLTPSSKVVALCKTGKVDGDVSIELLNVVNAHPEFRPIVDELVKLSLTPAPAPKVVSLNNNESVSLKEK